MFAIIFTLCLYLSFLGKCEAVSIRGRRNQSNVVVQANTAGDQNRSAVPKVDSFPELKKGHTLKGRRTIRKARTFGANMNQAHGTKKSLDVRMNKEPNASIPTQSSKEVTVKPSDAERKLANFRAFYQRKKVGRERGDKKAKEWFKVRSARINERETGLTQRMKTAKYTQDDLERYQKRIARHAKYREKQKRTKIDLNQVPTDRSSRKNREDWTDGL
ncbi:uncharacterized protein FA14DRAFT_176713 [Meira miltonrushii]|uniref:Uncharacterized protein n=1 Tax=Meira miltonrushii TaxID=1280837 RepID=A0A316VIG0_9BASI|nr:uncharacterized protein FA14DRAFT_176713 [Meira miltonrushii]PWN37419.1 hypothetical protein FA14DRAFT_176713 [Meira miltonrushii]